MSKRCPTCDREWSVKSGTLPPEPPVGTWVRDRHGAVSVRTIDRDGNDGWTAAPSGFYAFGKWEPMWRARGPLVECGPWGEEGQGE